MAMGTICVMPPGFRPKLDDCTIEWTGLNTGYVFGPPDQWDAKTKILDIIGRDMPEALPRPQRGERCNRCHNPAGLKRCRLCNPQKLLNSPST